MSTGWNTQTEDKNSHVLLASTMPGQICIKSIINTRVQINYKTCIPVSTINPKDKNWFIWFWHFACIQEFWSHIWAFDLLRAVERFMAVMCLNQLCRNLRGVVSSMHPHHLMGVHEMSQSTAKWASMKCPNPWLNGCHYKSSLHLWEDTIKGQTVWTFYIYRSHYFWFLNSYHEAIHHVHDVKFSACISKKYFLMSVYTASVIYSSIHLLYKPLRFWLYLQTLWDKVLILWSISESVLP